MWPHCLHKPKVTFEHGKFLVTLSCDQPKAQCRQKAHAFWPLHNCIPFCIPSTSAYFELEKKHLTPFSCECWRGLQFDWQMLHPCLSIPPGMDWDHKPQCPPRSLHYSTLGLPGRRADLVSAPGSYCSRHCCGHSGTFVNTLSLPKH